MKQIIGILLLITVCHTKSAFCGAYLADFFSEDFGPQTSDSCWKEDNTFNDNICHREEVSCSFEGWSENFNRVPLKIDFTKEYLKSIDNSLSLKINLGPKNLTDFIRFSTRPFRIDEPIEIAKNAQATIYNVDRSHDVKKINILYQGIIPDNGKLSELAEREISEEILIKTDKKDENNYEIEILGEWTSHNNHFGTKLLLSEGKYPVKIFNRSKKKQMETILVVKKSSKILKKVFTINPSVFKTVHEAKNINWESLDDKDAAQRLKLDWEKEYKEDPLHLKEIHSFTVDNKTNLANFFEIQQGKPYIPSNLEQQFSDALIKHPVHKMKLSGTCFRTRPKDAVKAFLVKKDPNHESTTLGKIIVHYDRHKNDMHIFYETNEGKKEELKGLKYFDTNCRGESNVSGFIAVREVNGVFANLSTGPWGNSGWVELPYKDISQWGSEFELGELSNVSFQKLPNGKYLVEGEDSERSETPIMEVGDGSPEMKSSFTLEADKLWYKNGDFRPQYDCSWGC